MKTRRERKRESQRSGELYSPSPKLVEKAIDPRYLRLTAAQTLV